MVVFRNFLSQLEDERLETEARLEKMSRDMEAVYQSKVNEKLQKLDESKQNVCQCSSIAMIFQHPFRLGFENSRNISIESSTRRRATSIET